MSSSILKSILFADDTNLFNSNRNLQYLMESTNVELQKLSEWFKANKLSLNVGKTKYILFGNKHIPGKSFHLILDGNVLDQVKETKFLGVVLDEKLNWSQHINHICLKISRGLGIIGRVKHILPSKTLLMLYYSLIYPYISYCCIIWGSTCKTLLNKVTLLQKRVVRLITHSEFRSTTGPLFIYLSLFKVSDVHKMQILQFMCQFKRGMLPHSCMHYFTVNNITLTYALRNNNNFNLPFCRTNIRQRCVCYSGPKFWNTLPYDIQNSLCLSSFKCAVRQYILNSYQ